MKLLTEDQRQILEAFKAFYYSGKLPHIAVVQQFPGKPEELVGFENLVEEFIHSYLISQDQEEKKNER